MTMTDPIADMLTRIRNGSRARHASVDMPASGIKLAIARVLRDEGYVDGFEERGESPQKSLRVHLRYAPATTGGRFPRPVLMGIKRVSRPGLRVYARAMEIPRVFGGLGTAIVSTPQGVMSGARARRLKVGGEVLAHVW